MVWIRVLGEDDLQAAQDAAERLVDPRLRHFYDPQQRAAREMAAVLGGMGQFAWDVYLVFDVDAIWGDEPPQPRDWAHQLDHSAWAPAERRQKGETLVRALQSMLQQG